jgi:isopentenyldiphosphate isomerase/intracellular septation protein A
MDAQTPIGMNKLQLMKRLLPSLLPLVVFVVVDEFYGTSAGLIVAVGFGVAELIVTYFRDRYFDKFTLLDTGLIVILGGVSFALDNDIFFKLKPAMIGAIFCAILGISSFSSLNLFGMMSQRYLGGLQFNEAQVKQLNRSTRVLFYIFVLHTLLVLYAAFFMSKEAWAFISTVLFYLLFGAYFAVELVRAKLHQRKAHQELMNEEWLPLVDQNGRITGKAPRSVVHANREMLHPVVHLHVINSRKQLYLQKRSMSKQVEPGKWDVAVGGHVGFGENVGDALVREAREELGIREFTAAPLAQFIVRTDRESELVFMFTTHFDGDIVPNPEEVDEGKFWTLSELNKHVGEGVFTPGLELEYDLLKKKSVL